MMGEHPEPEHTDPASRGQRQERQKAVYRLVKVTRVLLVVALVGAVGLFTDCLWGVLAVGDVCLAFPIVAVSGAGALGAMGLSMLRLRGQPGATSEGDQP
jgi:hypothetical protein